GYAKGPDRRGGPNRGRHGDRRRVGAHGLVHLEPADPAASDREPRHAHAESPPHPAPAERPALLRRDGLAQRGGHRHGRAGCHAARPLGRDRPDALRDHHDLEHGDWAAHAAGRLGPAQDVLARPYLGGRRDARQYLLHRDNGARDAPGHVRAFGLAVPPRAPRQRSLGRSGWDSDATHPAKPPFPSRTTGPMTNRRLWLKAAKSALATAWSPPERVRPPARYLGMVRTVGGALTLLLVAAACGGPALVLETPSPAGNAPPAASPSITPSLAPPASSGPGASVAPVPNLGPC